MLGGVAKDPCVVEEQEWKAQNIQPCTSLGVRAKNLGEGFPGVIVVKNPPASAGDASSSPGPGRSHVPWSS